MKRTGSALNTKRNGKEADHCGQNEVRFTIGVILSFEWCCADDEKDVPPAIWGKQRHREELEDESELWATNPSEHLQQTTSM